ncbi:unnamed protein product [Arabidopsis lyrata]|uniref:Uncharacterized protein n=1 Tax=Arabidopsis lyrata subsp. lyrata TaxID=81972 RepID=D7L4P9_ARALL|nr:uncharacterized protein LOC9320609 [Arabidopsis lyrata subsp. lyrata]EFH60802.1 hypothetical protein ARALYDRAFT_896694 [Arabidopsis lyrata subsp. lyrata]CAH8259513.1 unnamed protein product [Arabidopsis lyrata]|eukprot:XP_002884543.1 uncharacterized protein LOC9320609 [Arabidopsis lyrata subsp. lyrata]
MLQVVGKYRWRQSYRYKKLTDQQEKLTTTPPTTTTTTRSSAKRQNLGKKNEIRAKGFRVNRSRKLVLKALALPTRIFNIYMRITNQMNKEGLYPNLVFSSHWGFPGLLNSRGGFR